MLSILLFLLVYKFYLAPKSLELLIKSDIPKEKSVEQNIFEKIYKHHANTGQMPKGVIINPYEYAELLRNINVSYGFKYGIYETGKYDSRVMEFHGVPVMVAINNGGIVVSPEEYAVEIFFGKK